MKIDQKIKIQQRPTTYTEINKITVFLVRLGDWGSALSASLSPETAALYGADGPTDYDETDAYQPPEVVFSEELLSRVDIAKDTAWRKPSYDIWSFGVLLLEVMLGTREVFHPEERNWKRTEHELRQQGISSSRSKMMP